MINKYILHESKDKKTLIKIMNKCILNNISFEFMNEYELYFYIYDEVDLNFKKDILGEDIINIKNIL